MQSFVDYVMSFYGKGGIYDMGATEEEVKIALNIRMKLRQDIEFDGDSFDREIVRDIILAMKEKV